MAKVYPIPVNGSAIVNQEGILAQCVRIPCDNSPQKDSEKNTYTEKWKGPYLVLKDIAASFDIGTNDSTLSKFHELLKSRTGQNNVQRYNVPDTPSFTDAQGVSYKGVWKVTGLRVQELEAGDHAILTLECICVSSNKDGEDLEEQDVWSISWQSYTVTPYAFCANGSYNLTSYVVSPSNAEPTEDWDAEVNRMYLDKAINSPQYTFIGDYIVYTPDLNTPDVRYYLPNAYTEIYKKVCLGRNAVYHTPVLTHQTAKKYNSMGAKYNEGSNLGENIDVIQDLPGDCPYKFGENDWEWIKVGDDMSCVKNKKEGSVTYTRREVFNGYPKGSIDKNYYGKKVDKFEHKKEFIQNKRWNLNSI